MKLLNIYVLVQKELKKLIRVPAHLFQALLFPIVLTGAFGLAFGSFGGMTTDLNFKIGVVDNDCTKWADHFVSNISENAIFTGIPFQDKEAALQDLKQGRIDALIIIPTNFGVSIQSSLENPENMSIWEFAEVELYIDQGSQIAMNAIPPAIQQILQKTIMKDEGTPSQAVHIGTPSEVVAEHFTQFDFMAPGLFAFAAIFLTLIVAEGFTEDRMRGVLRRIQLTPTSPSDVIISSIVANMIIAGIQVTLVFLISGLMGFKSQGDFMGIMVAFALVFLLAFCNVGFGLIAASIAKSPGTATTFSFIFILPQMFLGTFIPVPKELAQLVPSHYVNDAVTSILLRGASITSQTILADLAVMIIFCGFVTLVGTIIFAKFGKNKLV